MTLEITLGFAVHHYDWESGPRALAVDSASPRVCGVVSNTADRVGGRYPVPLMLETLRASLERGHDQACDRMLREAAVAMDAALLPLSKAAEPDDGDGWDLGGSVTLVAAVEGSLLFAHIGELRTTRVVKSEIELVLAEHSVGAHLIRQGNIQRGEARPHGSMITACLGTGRPLPADFLTTFPISGAERFIVACASLYERIAPGQIVEHVSVSDPAAAARGLLDAALAAGAPLYKPAVCIVDVAPSS